MLWKWNVWNTEPTVPSTEKNNFLEDTVEIGLNDLSYTINVYDTPLAKRWLGALKDILVKKRLLEKNFCFLGFAESPRNLTYLVKELNQSIEQINSFQFDPPYERIHPFTNDDFQYSASLPIDKHEIGNLVVKNLGKRLKHESCNLLHRYFEELQGTAWKVSDYYKQADFNTKYAIRQLNNICHEIESWVNADRKIHAGEPEWMRPSQITTFLNAPRFDLHDEDFELFKANRFNRELGGVYLHWSQVGKTLYEVFRDEHAPVMTEALCSEINHQKYYSGEFDVEWGQTINEDTHDFKKEEMDAFRKWLADNNYDWEDPRLSLGYIKLGQIDIASTFGNLPVEQVHKRLSTNLNITKIKIKSPHAVVWNYFPYTLGNEDWKKLQIEVLKGAYASSSLR